MPIPLIYLAAVGTATLVGGAVAYYGVDKTTGKIEEITEDAFNDAVNAGVDVIGPIAAEIGEGLEDLSEGIMEGLEAVGAGLAAAGNSLLDFIRGLGIAVLEGASDTVDYIITETKEFRVPVAQTITSLLIWFGAAMVVYRMIMKLN